MLLGGLRSGARCSIHAPTTMPKASSTPNDARTTRGIEVVLTNMIITSATTESHTAPRIRIDVCESSTSSTRIVNELSRDRHTAVQTARTCRFVANPNALASGFLTVRVLHRSQTMPGQSIVLRNLCIYTESDSDRGNVMTHL